MLSRTATNNQHKSVKKGKPPITANTRELLITFSRLIETRRLRNRGKLFLQQRLYQDSTRSRPVSNSHISRTFWRFTNSINPSTTYSQVHMRGQHVTNYVLA
jgi:hypothetical protein